MYEARGRVGGRMLSRVGMVEPGIVDDFGGPFVNTDHTDLRALLREFDHNLYDRRTDPRRLDVRKTAWFVAGRTVDEAEIADGLRLIAHQIVADAERVDADFDRLAPQFDRQTAKAYLDLHAGLIRAPFARQLLENAIRTEYGAEPEQSSALQLLFLLPTVRSKTVELLGYSDERVCGAGRQRPPAAAHRGKAMPKTPSGFLTHVNENARWRRGPRPMRHDSAIDPCRHGNEETAVRPAFAVSCVKHSARPSAAAANRP